MTDILKVNCEQEQQNEGIFVGTRPRKTCQERVVIIQKKNLLSFIIPWL